LPDLDDAIQRAQGWARRVWPGGGRPLGTSLGGGRGIVLLALALVALWLASGFYRVQPDEQGVVLRFGAFVRTTPPGLNYHLPWPIETVLRPPVTRINRIEIGYRSAAAETRAGTGREQPLRELLEESLMLTGDENIVDINVAVFWRIKDAAAALFDIRNLQTTIKSVSESVMREVIAQTKQLSVTERRAQIETDVHRRTQAILDQYGAGAEITQVQLQKADPPPEVIDSFRDVQRAQTDAERLRNEAEAYRNDIVPRARGDAAAVTARAEGARQASIAEATGQAQRFLSVLTAYQTAKDVTLQRMYLETMQDVLVHAPTVVVDENVKGLVPFLPLGELGRPPGPAASTPAPPSGAPASPAPPKPATR
jgi:membrane protease subunit HflK